MQLFVQEHITALQQLFSSSDALNAYMQSLEKGRDIDATSAFNLFVEPRDLWTALATPFVETVLGYITMGYHLSIFLKNHSFYVLLQVREAQSPLGLHSADATIRKTYGCLARPVASHSICLA